MCKEHIAGCYSISTVTSASSLGLILTCEKHVAEELCCVVYQPIDKTPGHGLLFEIPYSLLGVTPSPSLARDEPHHLCVVKGNHLNTILSIPTHYVLNSS